jgi:SRSO17 transposase
VEENNNDTAAWASIDDVADCMARVDAQVRAVLGRVLAQRRSVEVAFGYLSALSPGVKANCWSVAEEAGHAGPHRMQALLGSYRWDWKDLRGELPGLAAAWLPCDPGDLIGPGIAVDETAQLKHGDATACVAPQHAGCTGQVENCVTTVFSAYVTTSGQAWADFDVYMPDRWARDPGRRRAAGIPEDLAMTTKPDLAAAQLRRLAAAGLPSGWAAFDEVYTRSGKLRETCEKAGLAYVGILPCDFLITLPSGALIRADEAVKDAVFERRSCGTGTKGPRLADWALTATASPRHFLLIRRLISRPGQYTFYLCYAPHGRPATMPYFIVIAGRRWPVEETFKTGKDVLGWDQCQARAWDAGCRHTALAALAQLRQAAIRNALCGLIQLPPAGGADSAPGGRGTDTDADVDDADLRIPLGDGPVPAYPGQPRPRRAGLIRLSIAETARLARLAADWAAGLLTQARLAFRLRWSAWRRRHQAIARWYHHAARLAAAAT